MKGISSPLPAPAYTAIWEAPPGRLGKKGILEELIGAVPQAGLFSTAEWLDCAAAALPPERTLHTLYVFCGSTPVACLPLTRGRERILHIPAISLRLLGDPLTDRAPLLIHPAHPYLISFVLDQLLHAPFHWDLAILSELPEDLSFRAAVERWRQMRQTSIEWQHCSRSPVLRLRHKDKNELRASYPKTLATRLRRSRKKLEAGGQVQFQRLLPSPEEAVRLVSELKRIEDVSWKGAAGVGIFSAKERCAFFRDLSVRLAARGWLDIGLLRQNDRLISYRYGFRFRGVFLDYNLAYHPDWAPMAPGRILLEEMIASSVELGLEAVDASRSGLFHQHQLQEWTGDYMDHFELWIFSRSLRGKGLNLLRRRIRPGVKKILLPAETIYPKEMNDR